MVQLSKRIQQVSASPTLATAAKVNEMKAKGADIINLTVGEPDFQTPHNIKEAVIHSIESNKANHYTPAAGIKPLREAIATYYQEVEGIDYSFEEVIVTEGAKNALYTLFQVILNEGDEVIVLSPYWVSYTEQVQLAGGKPVLLETKAENGFKASVFELEDLRTEKTVALIINSPCNPTGSVYTQEELRAIGEWAVANDVLLVADEIYNKLVYNGAESVSIASLSEDIKRQTVTINGVSKTYAMTGWRIGYAIGEKELIKKMTDLASQSTSNPAGPSQYAALEAIQGDQSFVQLMRETYEKRLNFVYPLLEQVPGFSMTKPSGAFYVFVDAKAAAERSGFKDVSSFALAMIEEAGVAVMAGEGFGSPDYLRISYTQPEELLEEAIRRIKTFITEQAKEQ